LEIAFKALEYTKEDSFIESKYEYSGDSLQGWIVRRNGENYLRLGPGYRLLKSMYCGICSSDLSRRFLPFPLPQIIGHEVVAADPETDEEFVVEINDTCAARGAHKEIFCKSGLPTHCPERMVLGIDRLPGGFGPYILAPMHAAIPLKAVPSKAAALIEPFAAALHAVASSPPHREDRVAVLGAGRLGLLIIAALSLYRKNVFPDFRIVGLARRSRNRSIAEMLGADAVIDPGKSEPGSLRNCFDLVYDATGSAEGFEDALNLAKREVHLKSTHGREYRGVKLLTEMVVDELSILPFTAENLDFKWDGDNRKNVWIYMPQGNEITVPGEYRIFRGDFKSAVQFLHSANFKNRIPRFDLCIVSNVDEIDGCIRPDPTTVDSLLRPRGAILFKGGAPQHPLNTFLSSGKRIRASRCGDFHHAMQILKNERHLLTVLAHHFITHRFPAAELPRAFETAKASEAIKVVLEHV
jgi:threonine dehydrogenase-like Zn-dependent dehydrogenase